ncbi:MAG TPA: ABC transporter substrate-binding protein [Burkholderiales bacterium]|nr:ABC transporter substrate-binding protein [Burkholderiales bacterium]
MKKLDARRDFLKASGATALAATPFGALLQGATAFAQSGSTLTIAYNTTLPSLDPTSSAKTSSPAVQSIFKAIFDPYVDQAPDLSFRPGALTKWGWNKDKTAIELTLRKGMVWHDGSPVTVEDLIWSLERAGDEKNGNPMLFMWRKLGGFSARGNTVTVKVTEFEPALLKWLGFLTAYLLPKKAFTASKGGPGWDAKPVGSGPYRVEKFERDAYLRLKAFPKYWGPKPAFDTVVFKFVPDPAARVAEIESGKSDLTLEVPFEEYDRLVARPDLAGSAYPIADVAILFITDKEPMLDRNVRLAAAHAIDKQALVGAIMRGYGKALDTLQAPEYAAYDKSIRVKYDPALARELLAKSGYSTENPVRFTVQTTRGYKPKDYETVAAVVAMWKKVGIEAGIEVLDVAKHFDLQLQHNLAPVSFYNWGNAIGDPSTSTGFAFIGPFAVWRSPDVEKMVGPLFVERDEGKRIAGYQAVDRYLAEQGYVIPLMQYYQPVVHRRGITFTPHGAGTIAPQSILRRP